MSIAENIQSIQSQIIEATSKAARSPDEITLIAVSKTRTAEEIEQAYTAGQSNFGENYLQEALDKILQLESLPLTWHFIGPIQSNKTGLIAMHFDWVHSVDRLKIAQRLNRQRDGMPPLNICLQVNISQDPNKAGIHPEELDVLIEQVQPLEHIQLRGLMAIPAIDDTQAFVKVQTLFDQAQKKFPHLDTLSAGMSQDFANAIQHGSTMIRVGTSIFGPRANKRD